MKAEDTVMNQEQRNEVFDTGSFETVGDERIAYCKAQAEVSFNAGYEAGNQQTYEIGVSDGKVEGVAEGIKEVVDSVNLILKLPSISVENIRILWQAKLKEWFDGKL